MTVITARYHGKCSFTGKPIRPGDRIDYDRWRKTSALMPATDPDRATADNFVDRPDPLDSDDSDDSAYLARRTRANPGYVSHVFGIGGKEYYRNKAGRCEDAPCCGCCSI